MQPTRTMQGLSALVLTVLATAAVACGGSNDADKFIGTWMITQATATVDCSATTGSTPFMVTPSGNVEFAPGATTALAMISPAELDPATFCDFAFDVNGAVANIHGTQSCTLQSLSSPPFNAKLTPATWTFSVTGANSAEETASGTLELPTVDANNTPNGTTICQYTGHMATLTRVAKN